MSFVIKPSSIDPKTIESDLLNWIESQPDGDKWKDYFVQSSTGGILIKWISGLSSMLAYQATVGRREAYLQYALKRSSLIGIAQNLNYSVFRGRNAHYKLTLTPNVTKIIDPYVSIGTIAGYDIVLLKQTAVEVGRSIEFEVVIGKLSTEEISIETDQIKAFRFVSSDVSEDFRLLLNTDVVTTSKNLIDLVNDKYVVVSNAVGGVDVMYLQDQGKTQQTIVTTDADKTGSLNQKSWRISAPGQDYYVWYSVEGAGTDPGGAGTGVKIEIDVNAGSVGVARSTAKSLGALPDFAATYKTNKLQINTTNAGKVQRSSDISTGWPAGNWVVEQRGEDPGTHLYASGDVFKIEYISLLNSDIHFQVSDAEVSSYGTATDLTIASNAQKEEAFGEIKTNAPLFHETQFVIRGRNDYKKLFRGLDTSIVSTNGSDDDPAIVDLTYVRDDMSLFTQTEKDNFVDKLETYRPFGIRPPTISDPVRINVELLVQVNLSASNKDEFVIEEDVAKILLPYAKTLQKSLDTFEIEGLVSALEYVKYSRVSVTKSDSITNESSDSSIYPELKWNEFFNIEHTVRLL